ncbi:MAG: AAA family ATPase [Vicinamibacterales bacterium]|jgi:energy-coupling factor transporter ATP-binding protein EcfA2
MTKPSPPPKTVLDTILEWSKDRPAWQRDALRRIVSGGRLSDEDRKELLDLCKQGHGASVAIKPSPLTKGHLPANPGQGDSVSLVSVADVEGVNNLAPAQTLTFAQSGITIIYGDNGTGKSGYSRILKRACRARHAGKIEGNIYGQNVPARATATISYAIGRAAPAPEKWVDADRPHKTLSAVSVFDSECASVHINEKNEVAFRPFGLDIPDELAGACQSIKEALATEQTQLEKARNPLFLKPSWKETTAVGKALASLKHDTDPLKISAMGTLTGDETARLARLREDLSKNPAKAFAEQTLKADSIKALLDELKDIETRTADSALMALFAAHRDAGEKREAARLAAEKAFSGEPLPDIGSEVWRSLWEAARRYSSEAAYPEQPFPAVEKDARCVLCQQTLQPEALDRMVRFEAFIRKDTERAAQVAEAAVKTARQDLTSCSIGTRALRPNLREVMIQDADLARRTRRYLAAARLRRCVLLKNLGSGEEVTLPATPPNPGHHLALLESTIRAYAVELQNAAGDAERKKLEADLAELADRELLGGMLETVQEEIDRLKSIHFLQQCAPDTATNAITKLGNDIADTVITPKLRDRFQEEIVKLAAEKVRVEIVRSGGKYGSPQYQLRLFAKPDAKIKDILSEGERTCVALAAFLTEVATATHLSAFVFDDPVSSLDHRWRRQVAKRLVEEAEHRQVVVFTHDLVFVNDLHDLAYEKKRAAKLVTVSRGPAGAGVVAEGLPWKAQSVEDRIDKLEKTTREAKKLYENNAEEEYAVEAAGIYDGLRASWERALEDVALFRVVQRHRDYIDQKNIKKITVLNEADCDAFHAGFRKCCDVVDAHDPSSGRNAVPPPPTEIIQDLQALKDWVAALRDRQKKIA